MSPALPSRSPRASARGALLGLAVGDALGTTLEFSRPRPQPFLPLLTGPHVDIRGGGPFGVARGQVTDDTQMAVCLASSLLEKGGFEPEDVAARYREWVKLAFDAGNLTRMSLSEMGMSAEPVTEAGFRVWRSGGRSSAGNGSLMRCAPIAVLYWKASQPQERQQASLLDSALTHADPRCQLACASFNATLAAAIQGERSREVLLQAAEEELVSATARLLKHHPDLATEAQAASAALKEDLEAARGSNPGLYQDPVHFHDSQGFVRVAYRLAFWELMHAAGPKEALIDVVNRGGDADTNGAITGALLGAAFGEGALPEPWRRHVLEALSDVKDSPWWALYHPRLLLPLAELVP